jgi:AraC family transcriptional regulator of adaptative response / DNA-3-methyladenine glycosylase II
MKFDKSFDGKFFYGVKTTGIYCRPICPARPKLENIVFFWTAKEAQEKGYRACKRCRPDARINSPAWKGTDATVERAMRIIADRQLPYLSEEDLAKKLGMSSRHLRRLFKEKIGQTPKQISDNYRLLYAEKLILETQKPMTDVAFQAGFQSLRRFNDAILKKFKKSPRELRRTT